MQSANHCVYVCVFVVVLCVCVKMDLKFLLLKNIYLFSLPHSLSPSLAPQYDELSHYGMDGVPMPSYGDTHTSRNLAHHLGHGPGIHAQHYPPAGTAHRATLPSSLGNSINDTLKREKDAIYG